MAPKKQSASARTQGFRECVAFLRGLPSDYFNDWELDWLDAESRRRTAYEYTDKEHAVLDRLLAATREFEGYDGCSIETLIGIVQANRAELDEDDNEFLNSLLDGRPLQKLAVRLVVRLARLAKRWEPLGRDDAVESAWRRLRYTPEPEPRALGRFKAA